MIWEKYRDVAHVSRDRCMVCEKKVPPPVIELPSFPLTEIYVDAPMDEKLALLDQGLQFCPSCGHAQMMNVADMGLQYGNQSSYFFRTSQSFTGRETVHFFLDFFRDVVGQRRFRTIVEVGSNDLYLLRSIRDRSDRLIGIDPVLRGRENEFSGEGITAIGDFFENVDLDTNPDLFICKDALEHVEDPKAFFRKFAGKAPAGTLFFFQFPILETILSECRFDQVFHQHVNYFSLRSLIRLLDEFGCGLIDYRINYNHWGAGIFAFEKGASNAAFEKRVWPVDASLVRERFSAFSEDMDQTRKRLEFFKDETLYGYGAALMLPVLAYHLQSDLSSLRCIIDDDPAKDGRYYINLPVPICDRRKIKDISEAVILLTAVFSKINAKMILANLFKQNPRHIIYPLKTL